MKTIEEKAKAYDEAIRKLRGMMPNWERLSYNGKTFLQDLIYIIPELAESEDEKVRKEIIRFIRMEVEDEIVGNKWLAWLERQGDYANFRDKAQVGDRITKNEDGVLVNLSQLNRVANAEERQVEQNFEMKTAAESLGVDSETYNKIIDECIFGDQNDSCVKDYNNIDPHFGKSIDKTEPKFHEGDWVVSPNGVYWHIDKISNNRYEVTSNTGESSSWNLDTNIYHKFNIQDAKDGDVLICKGNIKNSNGIKYERICLFNNLNNAFFTLTKTSNFVEEYDIDVNIDYPDNTVPATKEQKEILFMAMADAGYTFDFEKKELKKIEQKPAWSEDDETYIEHIITAVKNYYTDYKGKENPFRKPILDFLKSLKERYTWRPSDEQMDALHYVTNFDYGGHKATLVSLYEQLKKLKE